MPGRSYNVFQADYNGSFTFDFIHRLYFGKAGKSYNAGSQSRFQSGRENVGAVQGLVILGRMSRNSDRGWILAFPAEFDLASSVNRSWKSHSAWQNASYNLPWVLAFRITGTGCFAET